MNEVKIWKNLFNVLESLLEEYIDGEKNQKICNYKITRMKKIRASETVRHLPRVNPGVVTWCTRGRQIFYFGHTPFIFYFFIFSSRVFLKETLLHMKIFFCKF